MVKERLKPFIAPDSTTPITQEDINKRIRMINRAEEIGIYLTIVDSNTDADGEYENPYKMEALKFILQDQEVPENLKQLIKNFEIQHKETHSTS